MARKMKTMDGNSAVAHVSYAFTDVAAIYPITPSSVMADLTDKFSAQGVKNLFGREVQVTEMQSEGGASGAVHGSLAAGALTTTYTASQGLLLMIPNMYKMAGELLPSVIHVSARALTSHALSIFGDHSDIYACRQTGYAMLCSNSPQECMDLAAVAHLSAIKGRVPFLHFFDGFRTSHEIQKIEEWDYADLADMLDWDAVEAFRRRALNPEHPVTRGTAQNDDIFFQAREACNKYYDAVPEVVVEYMNKVNAKIGTNYKPFNYYGAEDAEHIIVAMGSVCDCAEEVVDYLNAAGEKVGLLKVRLYRPFVADYMLSELPKTIKTISVLDRTKEPGSIGEPLYLDVLAAINGSDFAGVKVYTGRYGLGSKDTTPGDIIAVYRNAESETPKRRFTIGIVDDVTNLSLPIVENPDTTPAGTHSCKFWGLGADGTVGANKNSIKIIGDNTDMYAQGYFAYDSKKSGGLTVSHLRFGNQPIKSTYYISKADFVACHNPSYVDKYDIVDDLKEGGSFLLNCPWNVDELSKRLPGKMKKILADRKINFYTIDGIKIGKEIGLGGRINTVLQSAFFKIADIIPADKAKELMKAAAKKSYMKKGQAIVDMNYAAIDRGMEDLKKVDIPADWANAVDDAKEDKIDGQGALVEYVNGILKPVNAYKGNKLPVSAFMDHVDGTAPNGSAAYEKRGIAVDVPEWNSNNCIQCNRCAIVCPHAVIRPIAMTDEEVAASPEETNAIPMMGLKDLKFVMTVSTLDCTGCGACANVCPGKKGEKALVMKPIDTQRPKQALFDYALTVSEKPEVAEKFKFSTVKGSQFKQPLLEFSGACAGCGETPYAKLVTQLFGDRMFIANATGCSSIWGASAPATPYTRNKKGYGPAWQNSLFEDNAEFGLGMALGQKAIRNRLIEYVENIEKDTDNADLKNACQNYLDTVTDSTSSRPATDALIAELEKNTDDAKVGELAKKTLIDKDELAKKSMWIFGGDGWAYDIGFGGLDHVIASGENVNILVFDTEVYSNTGGQASKATPVGSVAQFAAAGKAVKKKDLAAIAMSYGYVYVAQCAMGADNNQVIKAMVEAESYNGPSLVICYAPCINHGIKGGMGIAQLEEKKAVDAGYWNIFRFDPRLADEGKNPFMLDGKAPSASYRDFIMGEVRYNSLTRSFPERAEKLFEKAEKVAEDKYAHLLHLAGKDAE
ncbi:MAG: pyruvate:ferredoxin (flavodoxin) oxidoreductase [Ruminococcus bromii]|jgi:pyruvate-ferredoxin/flavodoxin oxidoreductase|uniref:pyruvate:ferredoxin (flavodoxin) oxidoreductase n=1 Tax=Ruminococcus sp. YE282 TaxID=3158780 RepID=UPI00087EC96A|nr:pyruvate:ferredoxin (flavodoxin) oxidoreductase [Ruminococcus bromii]HCB94428.1 pyruvate:ferredoxin (flavodoxin) oxidoreductase [Ruminococcus sp.]MCI7211472.1 pyruvate:ferredoxin (flavodoxin) oxidoreductase [Ruminococcus bromii]MDD6433798.1 pyruvate:ferredoxin (flavodoxin) oxidoreductase [Ruminococcus bromii]MDY4084649.1 pyruvate:ferredoxin (flavodoxin) oxidoreductase [Ruminococcus bromii]